jgi:thymidylate synthase ThyX
MLSPYGTAAYLVWDGGDAVQIPEAMGKPAEGQMQGAAGERLSELAGRVCYDSLGKGRSSSDYHKHIQEVKHGSVYEHAHLTVFIAWNMKEPFAVMVFLNRPGLWVRMVDNGFLVTFNPRVLIDWEKFGGQLETRSMEREILHHHAAKAWPLILMQRGLSPEMNKHIGSVSRVVEPEHDEERWVTLFLSGSRGFSHELVRHGDFTAISQRSTRFVQENESEWIDHPLVQEFLASKDLLPDDPENRIRGALGAIIGDVKVSAREVYGRTVEHLQKWLTAKGIDKLTARKQARGAARGYLGNALETEVIFSASIGQWKRMLSQRACDAADAEIRSVFIEALAELKKSRYADCFAGWSIAPAKDGIGETAVESLGVQV